MLRCHVTGGLARKESADLTCLDGQHCDMLLVYQPLLQAEHLVPLHTTHAVKLVPIRTTHAVKFKAKFFTLCAGDKHDRSITLYCAAE